MTETTTETQRPAYGLRRAIETVKVAVPVEDYAGTLTELRNLRGRCPIHGGDNPQSFAVYPDEGRWFCFRCNEGGDVIDLYRTVEGGEVWEAMMSLAIRYGVELPQRPPGWSEWQDEKGKRRRMIRANLAASYRRRYFRAFYSEYLLEVEPELREAEAERLWEGLEALSLTCADRRLDR